MKALWLFPAVLGSYVAAVVWWRLMEALYTEASAWKRAWDAQESPKVVRIPREIPPECG